MAIDSVGGKRRVKPSGAELGCNHGDEFYRLVAEVWAEALTSGWKASAKSPVPTPGLAVAETWDVPASTAHRWAKEARRRGLLTIGMDGAFCRTVHCPDCGAPMRHKTTHQREP